MKEESKFTHMLKTGAEKLGFCLDDAAIERLYIYFVELTRWSKRINLISRGSTDEQIIENHFLDSLTLLPLLDGPNNHLLDVGTGAGFPGLVCGAASPAIRLTLVEPRLKRVSFLRHIVRTLDLEKVEVISSRIEDTELIPSGSFYSHISSRAVSDMSTFLDMVSRFVHPETEIICMRGAQWQKEMNQLSKCLEFHSFDLGSPLSFQLPFSGAERALLIIRQKNNSIETFNNN